MTRKRWLGLLIAALLVPLPAFALSGGSASASLNVSVANGGCGVAGGSSIVCRLEVSFSPVPGATSYTASVTAPGGSVVDYGAIGTGGATIPVPYTGDGTYSVTVNAYGKTPTRHTKPIATDTVGHVGNAHATVGASSGTRGRAHGSAQGKVSSAGGARSASAGHHASASITPNTTTTGTTPTCNQPPPPPPPTTTTTPTTTTPTTTTTTTPTTATPPGQVVAKPPPPPSCPNP